jgi:hypothetical protein
MAQATSDRESTNGDHLVEPPIVDSLDWDERHHCWNVLLVPEDSVSQREKETVSIPASTPDGRRVELRLRRLSRLLGMEVRQVRHGGDGNFSFWGSDGTRRDLAEPRGQVDLSTRVYVELTDIAMTAQLAFLSQQSAISTQ